MSGAGPISARCSESCLLWLERPRRRPIKPGSATRSHCSARVQPPAQAPRPRRSSTLADLHRLQVRPRRPGAPSAPSPPLPRAGGPLAPAPWTAPGRGEWGLRPCRGAGLRRAAREASSQGAAHCPGRPRASGRAGSYSAGWLDCRAGGREGAIPAGWGLGTGLRVLVRLRVRVRARRRGPGPAVRPAGRKGWGCRGAFAPAHTRPPRRLPWVWPPRARPAPF